MIVTERAPAKINLALLVGPLRPDDYHELFTVFTPVPLYDELTFSLSLASSDGDAGDLVVECPDLQPDDDLVLRALRALEEAVERRFVGRVEMQKGIPIGAGLGGGSSDAALALSVGARLLAEEGGVEVDGDMLRGLARSLGADVPFFLQAGAAFARGIGDRLERVELPPVPVVMVLPSASLSTASVYAAYDRSVPSADPVAFAARVQRREAEWRELTDAWKEGRLAEGEVPAAVGSMLENDLETASFSLMPELADVKQAILGAGALGAVMSGSGPALFGICSSSTKAAEMSGRMEARGYAVRSMSTVIRPM